MASKVFGLGDTGQFGIAPVGYSGVMSDHDFWILLQISMPPFIVVSVISYFRCVVDSEGFSFWRKLFLCIVTLESGGSK